VIYVMHHLLALALALMAAGYLLRARWVPERPWVAIALWQLTALTLFVATTGGLIAVGVAPWRKGVITGLGSALSTGAGGWRLASITAGLALMAAVLVAQAVFVTRMLRRRVRHRDLLALVARENDGMLEVEHPVAVAYCLPGRGSRIVVSTGARDALTDVELRAVLAHEAAHLRARHHLVLWPFTALARTLPRWALLRRVEADLALLVEMCADDHAARRHGPDAVIGALRKFQHLGSVSVPEGTLAATSEPVPTRVDRLSRPRPAARPVPVAAALLAAATVLATPLSLYVSPL
jgi:Zn-dependent protease with chaperone function